MPQALPRTTLPSVYSFMRLTSNDADAVAVDSDHFEPSTCQDNIDDHPGRLLRPLNREKCIKSEKATAGEPTAAFSRSEPALGKLAGLLLMPVFPKALLSLMGSNLMSLTLTSAGHGLSVYLGQSRCFSIVRPLQRCRYGVVSTASRRRPCSTLRLVLAGCSAYLARWSRHLPTSCSVSTEVC